MSGQYLPARQVLIRHIKLPLGVEVGARDYIENHVDRLAKSIEKIGMWRPITVAQIADEQDVFYLLVGNARYRACIKLGHASILATVYHVESMDELKRFSDWKLVIEENRISA